jgi:hypothetical protein
MSRLILGSKFQGTVSCNVTYYRTGMYENLHYYFKEESRVLAQIRNIMPQVLKGDTGKIFIS